MRTTAQQLLRALRGTRSQIALARRLGYRANPITDWENGRSFPYVSEMLRLSRLSQVNVTAAFARFSPNVPLERQGNGFAVAAWMRATLGTASISEMARRLPCSRSSLSRWVSGVAEPRLPDFLRFVDCATGRLPDLVAELVSIEAVPALFERHRSASAAKRVAFDHPWTEALLRILESEPYAQLAVHSDTVLAQTLELPSETVRACLQALETAELIAATKTHYVVKRPLTVDTRGGQAALRAIKAHWARVAAARALAPRADDVFAYNVLSASAQDLDRIRDVLKHAFREIRSIVAASAPSERTALINVQLVGWDLDQ